MARKIVGEPARADAVAGERLAVVVDGLASVKEAEEFLRVSRAKLYAIMDAGELAYAKLGKSRRIPWAALREYAARCLQG